MTSSIRLAIASLIGALAANGVLAGGPTTIEPAVDAKAALSSASGLPEADVAAMLADCSASQQAQTFCAWRDQLMAERVLDVAIADARATSASCSRRLGADAKGWKALVQKRCRRNAAGEWSGGSMQRAAELACVATAYEEAAARLSSPGGGCRLAPATPQ